jgi:hypothetical protein
MFGYCFKMMKFVLLPLVVLMLFSAGVAQTPEKRQLSCPVISVLTPAGITEPGEPARYQAIVIGDGLERLKYRWTVSKGKIVSGQGTDIINAVFTGYPRIEATVKVTGLPEGCTDRVSAVYAIVIDSGPIELGEIAGPGYLIGKRLLTKIGSAARKNPNAQLYVALQFARGTPDNFMQKIRNRIASQLKKTKIDAARMTFVVADNGNKNVIFWLIRPGSEYPSLDH